MNGCGIYEVKQTKDAPGNIVTNKSCELQQQITYYIHLKLQYSIKIIVAIILSSF